MFELLSLVSFVTTGYQAIKKAMTPTITAEQWGNKDLIYEDIMNGVSVEQRIKNAQNGKYIVTEKYSKPHRDAKTGKIIIENEPLYREDVKNFGAHQAWKWVQQGKYNLTPEEFAKEKERIKNKIEYLCNL